jgi:hypothetical protein
MATDDSKSDAAHEVGVFPDLRSYPADLANSAPDAGLRHRFNQLAADWKEATQFASSTTEIAMHPAYQQIIGIGPKAIPLILEQLRIEPDHWFWALKAITGEDPVIESDRGHVRRMTQAWIAWATDRGYE